MAPRWTIPWIKKRSSRASQSNVIEPRPPTVADCGRTSIAKLENEVLLLVCQILHDVHPQSLASLRLVNSNFNSIAAYAAQSTLRLDLSLENASHVKDKLDRLERGGLLPAVRTIKISRALDEDAHSPDEDNCDCRYCTRSSRSDRYPNAGLSRLRETLHKMSGLRDIFWPRTRLSRATLDSIPADVRLHIGEGVKASYENFVCARQLSKVLSGSRVLRSFGARVWYSHAKDALDVIQPVKELLLSCPNLRSVTLRCYVPVGGCTMFRGPVEYCGMGFADGERPPPLEELYLECYPFGRVYQPGYHGREKEVLLWRDTFDWSRLRVLECSNPPEALCLIPKLQALESLRLGSWYCDDPAWHSYFRTVSPGLRSLAITSLPFATLEGIIHQGDRLEFLEIHSKEHPEWRANAVDGAALRAIRAHCPNLRDLRIDLPRGGGGGDGDDDDSAEWPLENLDILGGFPNLRDLQLWFELGSWKSGLVKPVATVEAVRMMFRRLWAVRGAASSLRVLRVDSGCPRTWTGGLPAFDVNWPMRNCARYVCALSERDDCAAKGEFVIQCPGAGDHLNEYLRGERRFKDMDLRESKISRVALNGPTPYGKQDEGRAYRRRFR